MTKTQLRSPILAILAAFVAGCGSISIQGQVVQPAEATATAQAPSREPSPTSPTDWAATAAIERAVQLTLTAAVPAPTHTLSPSLTAEPTSTRPPTATPGFTDTATPSATRRPVTLPTFTPVPQAEAFTGTWVGPDTVDNSVTTLVLLQTGNTLTGTFSDTYSKSVPPPGFQGSGSGVVHAATSAEMTFNLSRWDGVTVEAHTHLELSNQNNTLTLTFDGCDKGCPIIMQRQ